MSAKEYRYFRIDGGAVFAAHTKFIALHEAQAAARSAVSAKYGAERWYGDRRGLVGLCFEKPPEGWRRVAGEVDVYKPPTGKAGKKIREELAALPLADGPEYHAGIAGGIGFAGASERGHGFAIRYIVFQTIGDVVILLVPRCKEGDAWQPPDAECVPLKTSEYWQMKEAAAESGVAA